MPATITPHLLQMRAPTLLADLPGWLLWRFEHPPGGGKPRKVPYYASGRRRHGVQGRHEDREQLVTFEAAKAAAARKGFDGVGFAPMPEWKVTALDFDACVLGGRVDREVEDLVASTYAEFSPSGNGVRAFVAGALGNRKAIASEQAWGFETFSSKGFVTFTGNLLPVCQEFETQDTIAPASDRLRALCESRFSSPAEDRPAAEPLGLRREVIEEALDSLDPDMGYPDWLRVGMALHHELGSEGFDLWDAWSARSPKYTTSEYNLERWESFGRQGGPAVTIRSLIHLANQHGAHVSISQALEASAFDDLTASEKYETDVSVPSDKPLRFPFVRAGEFVAAAPQRYWIKGMLPEAPLAVIYGESGSGKTFAVLDMVLAIARGIEWRGRRTRKGRVAYIAAEGSGGLRKRLKAYADFNGIDVADIHLVLLADAPNFLLAADVVEVIRGIQAAGGADVVVIDTLAQVTPGGNENGGEDMGKALAHCRQITRILGASVVLVHHAGKDASRGARGWSGLKAAADAELEVVRNGDDRALRLSKAKDDLDGASWGFRLNVVSIGEDEDGDPITSCVVEPGEVPAAPAGRKAAGGVQKVILRVLDDLTALGAEDVAHEDLVTHAVAQLAQEPGKRDQRAFRVRRAITLLQGEGAIAIANMRVRAT
jgi:hypothetical protein